MNGLARLLAGLVLFSTAAQAQAGNDLSLAQAVEAALRTQPLLRSAQLGLDLSEKRVTEARTGRLPTLQVSQTISRGNNPVFVFGSLLEQGRFGPNNFALSALNNPEPITNVRTSLAASLPVLDGLKTSAHIAEAKIQHDQSGLQVTAVEQRIRFDVLRQYFEVIVAQAKRQVVDEGLKMAESDLKRATDRIEAGLVVESDRLAAKVQFSELTQQHIDSEANLATAIVALNVAIGARPATQYHLTQPLEKRHFNVPSQEELLQRAMLHRPDYLQASSGIQFAERQLLQRKGAYLPEINLFGSFGNSGRNWSSGSTDYAVGTGITLNILEAGRASRVSQARIEEDIARTERDRIGDQIVVEVVRAYQQYRSAVQQLEVAETTLSQASEAVRIIQDRYEAGLTTMTDLLRAETALVRAQMNVTSANQGIYVGYANILLAIGELNDVYAFES